jgi:hypothetical protein
MFNVTKVFSEPIVLLFRIILSESFITEEFKLMPIIIVISPISWKFQVFWHIIACQMFNVIKVFSETRVILFLNYTFRKFYYWRIQVNAEYYCN